MIIESERLGKSVRCLFHSLAYEASGSQIDRYMMNRQGNMNDISNRDFRDNESIHSKITNEIQI